jgi:hypothetical protein
VSPICQICMGSFGNNCLLVAAPSMERIKLLLESCIFSALINSRAWLRLLFGKTSLGGPANLCTVACLWKEDHFIESTYS